MNLLEVKNLNVQYQNKNAKRHPFGASLAEEKRALNQISFSMQYGEILGVVGESGSGKSTLARTIAGLLPKSAQSSYDAYQIHAEQQQIAMVFQEPKSYLNPSQKVGNQLIETIQTHAEKRMTRLEIKEKAKKLLEQAGLQQPENWLRRYPHELSGGQCQRVVLAIAFACEPKLLIADEPTSALDVTAQKQILYRMKQMSQENGTAILLISHDFAVISAIAERVLVMQHGSIVESGATDEIFYNPQHTYTRSLIQNAMRRSRFGEEQETQDSPFLLEINHVWKNYRKPEQTLWAKESTLPVIKDISLHIRKGQIYGLLGESGCGKTTLAKLITGLERSSKGEILFRGETLSSDIKDRTLEQIQSIQMVFQDTKSSLDSQYTIEKILWEAFAGKTHTLQNKWKNRFSFADVRKREPASEYISKILQKVGLSESDLLKYPTELSGGQRQRIGIARALLTEPELLILDEAVSALDVTVQEEILQLLTSIQKEKKMTYLFISHDLQIIRRVCDTIGVMYAGQIVETGNVEAIYREPWHPYTKMLLDSILSAEPRKAHKKSTIAIERWTTTKNTKGCPFVSGCRYAMECCKRESPGQYQFGKRKVSCFLYSEKHAGKRSKGYKMSVQI